MAQYVKATNFASKDALLTGDPNKIVKGAEIDDEFSAIQTAVNSKADTLSPTLTGTPLAPTATAGNVSTQIATTAFVDTAVSNGAVTERSATATLTNKTLTDANANTQAFGNNTTKVATTAFVQTALQAVYPVGSVYISTVATNPATTFGFGTWAEFGAGKVLVGQDAGDASFDTLGETGGSKDAIVVSHTHTFSATTGTQSANHTHSGTTSSAGAASGTIYTATGDFGNIQNADGVFTRSGYLPSRSQGAAGTGSYANVSMSIPNHTHTVTTGTESTNHTHSVSGTTASSGSSGTNANLQPYVVVKMWKRTA